MGGRRQFRRGLSGRQRADGDGFDGLHSTRELGLANGNLYFTETGDGIGVMGFSGLPQSSATPSLAISTSGKGTGSPKGFAFNLALTIAYIVDNGAAGSGGGVLRYNWNGSAWVYAYTLGNTVTSSDEVDDIAVDFSGANPILYAVTGESSGNHIIKATDTGAGSTFSSIETASSGDAFAELFWRRPVGNGCQL